MPELNTDYGVDLLGTAMKATTVKRGLLENAILEQKSKELPDILQHEKKQRAMEMTQGEQAITSNMFKLAKDASNFYLPKMNYNNWDAMKSQIEATFAKIGMPVSIPTRADIETRAREKGITPEAAVKTEIYESLSEMDQWQKQFELETERISAEAKEKPSYEMKTIYGPGGATKEIPIEKGTSYTPPVGWSLNEPPKEGANQTKEQLTARSLRGDKEATAILDAMDKREKDIVAIRGNSSNERANRQFAVTLRKEFNSLPEVKEYNQTVPKIRSMQSAYELSKKTKNFVAVDQALITLYNKLTDPQSVVRESEYARTAENIPLINQLKGKIEKIMKGGAGLTAEERKGLMDMANLMQKGYDEIRQRRLNEYRGYGVAGGLDSNFLIDANAPGQKKERTIVEQRITKDGRILTKYSDGSIE